VSSLQQELEGLLEELHHAACMCFRKETTYKESCERANKLCCSVSMGLYRIQTPLFDFVVISNVLFLGFLWWFCFSQFQGSGFMRSCFCACKVFVALLVSGKSIWNFCSGITKLKNLHMVLARVQQKLFAAAYVWRQIDYSAWVKLFLPSFLLPDYWHMINTWIGNFHSPGKTSTTLVGACIWIREDFWTNSAKVKVTGASFSTWHIDDIWKARSLVLESLSFCLLNTHSQFTLPS
jgi:hypothetical protein